jgi:hypothetical protein
MHSVMSAGLARLGRVRLVTVLLVGLMGWPSPGAAQIVEATGSRALGMGGAFTGLANDSSATWWNPGALAAGPLIDAGLSWAVTDSSQSVPARRDRVSSFAIAAPMFGVSYYRLRVTEIRESPPIGDPGGGREDEEGLVPVRSLSVRQFGATIVQTLLTGVHVGATVKYLRGSVGAFGASPATDASDLLEAGEDFETGETEHRWDLDIGAMAVAGPFRFGAVARNIREPRFAADSVYGTLARLPRQVRAGASFDGEAADIVPLTVALDVDLRRYETVSGERRVVAIGAEHRLLGRRLAVRGGGRFNTVGAEDRAGTLGLSVAIRSGFFVDGHVVRGGAAEDRGWGIAARVSI